MGRREGPWGRAEAGGGAGRAFEPGLRPPLGAPLSPLEFGNLQKLDGPTEQCRDPAPAAEPRTNCSADAVSQGPGGRGVRTRPSRFGLPPPPRLHLPSRPPRPQGLCEQLLPLAGCGARVAAAGYLEACRRDLCACDEEPRHAARCLCATLAEFSRQCAHAGGRPAEWRRPDLCRECGAEDGGRETRGRTADGRTDGGGTDGRASA